MYRDGLILPLPHNERAQVQNLYAYRDLVIFLLTSPPLFRERNLHPLHSSEKETYIPYTLQTPKTKKKTIYIN